MEVSAGTLQAWKAPVTRTTSCRVLDPAKLLVINRGFSHAEAVLYQQASHTYLSRVSPESD